LARNIVAETNKVMIRLFVATFSLEVIVMISGRPI